MTPAVSANFQYLINDATVRSAQVAPHLVGLRLAQVPQQSASLGVTWKSGIWSVSPSVRYVGDQFEDDTNALRLAPATIINLAVNAALGRNSELFLSVENVADYRVETGRSTDGVVNIGSPRLLLFGFRLWH